MASQPPIILSSLDVERIERLLDSGAYDDQPGLDRLIGELNRAKIVDPEEVPQGVVTMNSTVRVRAQDDGRVQEYTLVYPRDADAGAGRVSVLAPAGSALLGLSQGQHIDWPSPTGQTLHLEVEEVLYQPESKGEYHR